MVLLLMCVCMRACRCVGGRACLQQDVEVGGGLGRDGKARVLVPQPGLHQGLGGPLQAASWPALLLRVLHQGCVGCQQLPGILRPSCTALKTGVQGSGGSLLTDMLRC